MQKCNKLTFRVLDFFAKWFALHFAKGFAIAKVLANTDYDIYIIYKYI